MTMTENALAYARNEMTDIYMRLRPEMSEVDARVLARHTVDIIDWNNDALMHKSLQWIAKEYLRRLEKNSQKVSI